MDHIDHDTSDGATGAVPTDRRPLGYWLRTVDAPHLPRVRSAFADEGVTRRDWMLLNAVSGDVDVPGLAERLARKGKRLAGLEKRGWVDQAGDGTWTLTDEGRAAKERIGAIVDGIRPRVAGAVSPEDFATTMASLEAIARELGWSEDYAGHAGTPGFGRGSPVRPRFRPAGPRVRLRPSRLRPRPAGLRPGSARASVPAPPGSIPDPSTAAGTTTRHGTATTATATASTGTATGHGGARARRAHGHHGHGSPAGRHGHEPHRPRRRARLRARLRRRLHARQRAERLTRQTTHAEPRRRVEAIAPRRARACNPRDNERRAQ